MRKFALAVVCLAAVLPVLAPVAASSSQTTEITFETLAPCHVACPYWIDEDPCAPTPTTVPGSWDDHRVTVPDGARALEFEIEPEIDYDAVACRVHNPGTPEERWEEVVFGCSCIPPHCDGPLGLTGCPESMAMPVQPGQVYVLRVYNWLDGPTCEGRVTWLS